MKTSLLSASTGQSLRLEDIKTHLRIPIGYTVDDAYLRQLRGVAQGWVEDYTNRKLIYQRHYVYLDRWPIKEYIPLPYAPLASAPSTAIVYKKSDGDSTTFSSTAWETDTYNEPGRISLGYDESWPTDTLWSVNPISIEFQCGYGNSSSDVPVEIRQAMLVIIGDLYENRENTLVGVMPHNLRCAERLLSPKRIFKF